MSLNSAYIEYSDLLSEYEKRGLDALLHVYKKWPIELKEMWALMDTVWEELGCDNENLDEEKINKYYTHPVWLLNGLFGESHADSMQHRYNISDWIVTHNITSMLDYGGGFCTLSRQISNKSSDITIDIIEPFPAEVSKKIIAQYPRIHFVDRFERQYDCIVALDVLEHVPDPLRVLADMIDGVRLGGIILLGNCFEPVIQCHLPSTFHFRHSFLEIALKMNLEYQGNIPNCYVQIYKKISDEPFKWSAIRRAELASKMAFRLKKNLSLIKKYISFGLR